MNKSKKAKAPKLTKAQLKKLEEEKLDKNLIVGRILKKATLKQTM